MNYMMAIALLVTTGLVAQQPPAESAPGYDVTKEMVVNGVVQETSEYQCPVTGTKGSHMAVKTTTETLQVHIAPVRFMREYEVSFKPGDEVKMVGTRIVFDGKPAFLPRSITAGRITYIFRTPGGMSIWW